MLIVILIGFVTLFYIWLKWNYSFWKRNKVRGPEPTLFVGNIGSTFTFSEHWGVVTANWYKQYSNEPYIGYYKLLQPAVLACDPDLIKDILITQFNKFQDNELKMCKKQDPLAAANPSFEKRDQWKQSRKTILPALSSSKIKTIMPVMNRVGEDFIKFIKSYPPNTDFNAKHLFLRFTTENVIKCAFSIDPGCFDKEQESEFVAAEKVLYAPSFLVGLKFLTMPFLPQWALDIIPIPFVPPSIDYMFRSFVGANKASRSKGHQSNDIFQTLLEIQQKHNFDDTLLAGHAFLLFTDGTETSSIVLSFALHELAVNPHCQEKLFDEIRVTITKHGGQLTVEALQEMIYLEGLVFELLRMHPVEAVLQKVCSEEYTLPKTNEQLGPVTIQPGTVVNIPVMAVHMDPKYYPNPDKFQPERFFIEEQRNRHRGTFLGFSEGPRMCLGVRFAINQVKVAVAHIVHNFRIKQSPNHKPIIIDPESILASPKDGVLIQLEKRLNSIEIQN